MDTTPITRRDGEEMTGFAIRSVQHETWFKAHAELCAAGDQCAAHSSPYADTPR
jgi:hypothetical protein